MKKVLAVVLTIFGVMILGTNVVNAESKPYWEKYFEENYADGLGGRIDNYHPSGSLMEWKDIDVKFPDYGASGDSSFKPIYYTNNVIFNNVEDVTVKSSDESIMTAEVKPYDFSKEKRVFEEFIDKYNKLTEPGEISFDSENYYVYVEFETTQKPTWWEYLKLSSESSSWWEFYGFDSEPANAVQIITHAKDLGNATLTVSAKNKSDIHINWTMKIVDGIKQPGEGIKQGGIIQILNNLDRYKDIMPGGKSSISQKDYTFSISLDKNEDISELINTLKGKDVKILFNNYNNGITTEFILNGKDITSTVGKGFTYDYNISMGTSINKDKINSLVELKDAIYIDFTYHGTLPAPYNMTINVKNYIRNQYSKLYGEDYDKIEKEVKNYLNNKKFTLLYYNQDTNKMEVVKEDLTANENGELNITFDHFSSYVVVGSDDYKMIDSKSNNAQTSSMNIVLYTILTLGSLVGITYIVVSKRKKKEIA